MERADGKPRGEVRQRERLVDVRIDLLADAARQLHGRVFSVDLVRLAALAGAKAGASSLFGCREEAGVFAFGAASRTRRPAVDASRAHGQDEEIAEALVTVDRRLPPDLFRGRLGTLAVGCCCHRIPPASKVTAGDRGSLSESCGQSFL